MLGSPARVVGVIGGAGVVASNELLARIEGIVTARGAYVDQQHPEILLLHATQAPSRSMWLEGRGPSFIPAYVEAATRLCKAGAEVVAMCCNTAHAAIDEIERGSGVRFINLVALALAEVRETMPTARRLGMLCSDGTRMASIYEKRSARDGHAFEFIYPSEEMQRCVTSGIRGVKRGLHRAGSVPTEVEQFFVSAANELVERGVDCVVLACTEIPLAFNRDRWTRAPLIDTVDILARACVKESGVFDGEG
jgi:aspartate racemase